MPGIAASTSETWLFGAPPNSVDAPENSFDRDETCACTSMPITTSQSPVVPRISLSEGDVWALMAGTGSRRRPAGQGRTARCLNRHLAPELLLDGVESIGEAQVFD